MILEGHPLDADYWKMLGLAAESPLSAAKQTYEMTVMFSPTILGSTAGQAVGGKLGGLSASAALTFAQSAMLWAEDWFDDHGYSMENPDDIREVFADDKLYNDLQKQMISYGATMAATQAAMSVVIDQFAPGAVASMSRLARLGKMGRKVTLKGTQFAGEVGGEMFSEFRQ